MSDATIDPGSITQDADHLSALFANLVVQQSNMAMMLLGKVAHPDSGKPRKDLEAAQLFIDHLAMLEVKTKGNLSKEESTLLKQTLMGLRMAFVEAVESSEKEPAQAEPAAPSTPTAQAPAPERTEPAPTLEEHAKKFSKKY